MDFVAPVGAEKLWLKREIWLLKANTVKQESIMSRRLMLHPKWHIS